MKYDLTSALGRVNGEPWELILTIDGADYTTRQLSVGDIDAVRDMGKVPADATPHQLQAIAANQRQLIAALFVDPQPDLTSASLPLLQGIVSAVAGYQQARALKNSRAIAAEVASIASK